MVIHEADEPDASNDQAVVIDTVDKSLTGGIGVIDRAKDTPIIDEAMRTGAAKEANYLTAAVDASGECTGCGTRVIDCREDARVVEEGVRSRAVVVRPNDQTTAVDPFSHPARPAG